MKWHIILLRDREAFWDAVCGQQFGWRDILSLALFVVVACSLYGAVLAGWRSPRLSVYVAIKLPALFLGTTAIVAGFNWMTASILGAGLSFRSTVLSCLAMVGLILVVVTLQMTTYMRPMLAKPEKGWWTGEKQFFLSHFGSSFDAKK